MNEYVDRLIDCGYDRDRALKLCFDFVVNLSVFDLACFVASVEERNVDKI